MPELLERDGELATLRSTVAEAAAGRGATVLIAGEAGIGKSTLLDAWCRDPGVDARILAGWCDDLLTSRTLGPFRDVARSSGPPLADAVAARDTGAVLDALLTELANPLRPTVLVIEDLHWADEATLDVVRYVGRRVERLPAVLALSYRDDLPRDHPLHAVLGALVGPVHRLVLHPLSTQAVAHLTEGCGLDLDEVVALTAGNPFFVTEVAGGEALPASVADAVLARVAALPEGARRTVELLSVFPGEPDHDLLAALEIAPDDLALAEAGGLLLVDDARARFRHELTRRAVEAGLPTALRLDHHRRLLAWLLERDDEAAILHHAMAVGDDEVVVAHAPRAAREAFRAGAHREADAFQRAALDRAAALDAGTRADLLEERSWTLYNLHRFDEAVSAARAAVELRDELGDLVGAAHARLVLSRMYYMANDPPAAVALVEAAVRILEEHGDDEARIEALVARAATYALIEEPADLAAQLTEEAVALTAGLDRSDLRSLALNYRAIAQCASGGKPDVADFRESLRLALEGGHLELAARAYTNLSFELLLSREPTRETLPVLEEALAFLEDHDFVSHAFDLRARIATVGFALGHWDDAERELRALRATSDQRGVIDLIPLESLARLAVRRGDPDADHVLDGAWELARRSGATPYMGLLGVIRVERAWLRQDPAAAADQLAAVPLRRLRPRLRAEHLRYAQLAGVPVEVDADVAEPWASGLRGDWRTAAAAWERDGRPYEQAVELVSSGDVDAILDGLTILDRLGAVPAADLARHQLREAGVRRVPRGPQTSTRAHPAGLTARQAEVLDLLVHGLTNSQIAERLVLSVRTVDHHVAAVLQKLGVGSRQDAAARAATFDVGWR